MQRTFLFSLGATVGLTLLAQTGTPVVFTIEPQEKTDACTEPFFGNDLIYRICYRSKIDQDKPYVAYVMRPDGGATAEVLVTKPSVPGVVRANAYFYFRDQPWGIFQGWDKETGKVSLFAQAYDPNSFAPDGAPFPIGTVALDADSYRGNTLALETYPSPDGTKLLIYFDALQAGNIKIAMCWVMDDGMQPVWNGMYRLPVQAYGAETNVHFFNEGQVAVDVEAIVLDEGNTKEKSDGSVSARVDKSYLSDRSTTLYVLHGETFIMWGGELANGVRATNAKLLLVNGEWRFLASTVSGKGKERKSEWVTGKMDDSFKPVETARGNRGFTQIVVDEGGSFHGISDGDDLVVMKFSGSGEILWEHSAPFGINQNGKVSVENGVPVISSPEFRIANGRLAISFSVSKSSLDNLLAGEKANADMNTYVSIPVVAIWDEGKRNVFPLLPSESNYKEATSNVHARSMGPKGILLDTYRQKGPSTTLVPIEWE